MELASGKPTSQELLWTGKDGYIHKTTLARVIEAAASNHKITRELGQALYQSDYDAQRYANLSEVIL